jgi:hypothetical protein
MSDKALNLEEHVGENESDIAPLQDHWIVTY